MCVPGIMKQTGWWWIFIFSVRVQFSGPTFTHSLNSGSSVLIQNIYGNILKHWFFFFFIVQNHLVGNFSSSFNFVFKILKQIQKRYDNWIFLGKTVNQPVFLTKKKNASEVLYFVFSCLLFWCCWNCFSAIYMFDQIWII